MNETPLFLTVEQVIELHHQSVDQYGGQHGIREPGLLESSVFAPQQTFGGEFLYPSLAEMAAAYWFSLVSNHVFLDGNKRIGLRAADVFLAMNGYDLKLSEDDATKITFRVSTSQIVRETLVEIVIQSLATL